MENVVYLIMYKTSSRIQVSLEPAVTSCSSRSYLSKSELSTSSKQGWKIKGDCLFTTPHIGLGDFISDRYGENNSYTVNERTKEETENVCTKNTLNHPGNIILST